MDMATRSKLRLDKTKDFWPLYKNPIGVDDEGNKYKVRYYQDGRFFGPGGVYVPVKVSIMELPKQAQADLKNIGGYRPVLTEEELGGHDILKQIQEEREALARERAELEKVKTVGKVEEETPDPQEPPPAPEVTAPEGAAPPEETKEEAAAPEEAKGKKTFQCPHCTRSYKVERYFKEHLKTHES